MSKPLTERKAFLKNPLFRIEDSARNLDLAIVKSSFVLAAILV